MIELAEVVLPGAALDETLSFFGERLGFRIESITPADSPTVAVLSGYGLRVRLERDFQGPPGTLRLACADPSALAVRDPAAVTHGQLELEAPNGTRVLLVEAAPRLVVPPLQPSLVITKIAETQWSLGRAGMLYRDLIPERQGGRFVASHICIPEGGPVPDYVHFHRVRFQMIYCYKGWVRVVYEDQGPPFVLRAGDCVLQPPQIRHRVLESSPGLEVIEVSCPAEHETLVDHERALPTPERDRKREYGGQRFVHHQLAAAPWGPWRLPGFEARDLGLASATHNLARARVARRLGITAPQPAKHEGELMFVFLLAGELTLRCDGQRARPLVSGDCFVIPPGLWHELDQCSEDIELLELCLPADLPLSS
ncbi:MAG: cupin domain-containing protein [Enhygromyxa sp.]